MTTEAKRGPGRPPLEGGGSVQVNIILTRDAKAKLRRLAEEAGLKLSQVVRKLIEEAGDE